MKKKNYLEDYTVINQIGKGGFGIVSKVQARYTGVIRAAKKIKKSSLANNDHEKLFAEMAIMITLDHPGISRLYEVYDYKSSYVMILELCEGG
jgi:serine/threonine protein kinase